MSPAQARVIEYWQEKAVFDTPEGESTVKVAARPIHPLGKCLASVQLLGLDSGGQVRRRPAAVPARRHSQAPWWSHQPHHPGQLDHPPG